MANLISFLILIAFFWGRSLWSTNLKLHIRVMCMVMLADLTLILGLVFFRRALEKVTPDMPLLLMIHVPIAVATVVLYGLTAWAGYQVYMGKPARRRLYYLDKALVTARVLTLLTSLAVQFGG